MSGGTDLVIAKLDSARVALYEATTIPQAKRFVDMGVTAETWAKQQKLSDEIINYAHAFTVDALAQLGKILKATPRAKARFDGTKKEPSRNEAPTLAELGLDKKTSSIAQKVASLTPTQLASVRSAGASIASAIRDANQPHVAHNSGENEWYTPPEFIEKARAAMGGIDCDPASSAIANRTVKAEVYYTAKDDGLAQEWNGRVWMNPPYAQPLCAQFCAAVTEKFSAGEIEQACVLVNNATETAWFNSMLSVAAAVCFPKGRIRFVDMAGNPSGAPLQGQAVLYFGRNIKPFAANFSPIGAVLVGV